MKFTGKKTMIVAFIVVFMAVVSALFFIVRNNSQNVKGKSANTKYSKEIFAMDTYMVLQAYGDNAKPALEKAEKEIKKLDNLLDSSKLSSQVYELNSKKEGKVSDDLLNLLKSSKKINKLSNGSFDISIFPVMNEWGFISKDFKVPEKTKLEELLKNVDESQLEIDEKNHYVKFKNPQMEIDLGGIAKGYASQKVMEIFKKYNVTSGIVSLGGNVQTYKAKPDGSSYKVGIQNPNENSEDFLGIISVKGKTVITSGGYERYFEKDGKRYHHILNPKTGYPSESGIKSVTIVSKDGTYRGSGKGFAGRITVEITIKNKTITSIKIVENQGDNDPYFSSAKGVLKEVVSKQSTNVDTVSGATFSSKGMLEAVNNALAKAKSANGNHKNNNSNDKNHGGSASDTTVTDNNTDENKKHIDQKYKDGVYEATVVCGPKNGGAFKPYNLHVKVTIEGGKITDITEINGSGEQYISADSRFISWAVNGKGNEISVVEQIKALKDINNISNGNVDAVSRATYSSKAIVIAVFEAVEQAKVE
ncbi:Thiamine biosynthesis lipoprotein ApbE [Lachnospiraceae bacterium C7]|nr:Thiamine biosynthesis lipoprotein ApbE [Lachnospiraceae bacterium C7]